MLRVDAGGLKFAADAEPVGQRCVDVARLASDALALGLVLDEVQRPHVVQAVGQLHQKDAHVLGDRQDELTQVFGLPHVLGLKLELGQLGDALDKLGADGLILMSSQNGIYVGDKRMDPLLAEMDRRGAVVFVHPARPAFVDTLTTRIWGSIIEYTFETTRIAAFLIYNEFMRKYPRIKWILAHAGGCLPFLSFRLAMKFKNAVLSSSFSIMSATSCNPLTTRL